MTKVSKPPFIIDDTTVSNAELAQIAELAAESIDTYGWIQSDFGTADTGFCALGAISYSATQTWFVQSSVPDLDYIDRGILRYTAKRRLGQIAGSRVPRTDVDSPEHDLVVWNDTPGRTQGEVTDLLREVAKDLRNQG